MKALNLLVILAGVAFGLLCVMNVVSMIATSPDIAGITLWVDLGVMCAVVVLAVAALVLSSLYDAVCWTWHQWKRIA